MTLKLFAASIVVVGVTCAAVSFAEAEIMEPVPILFKDAVSSLFSLSSNQPTHLN